MMIKNQTAHYGVLGLTFIVGLMFTLVNFYPDVPILNLQGKNDRTVDKQLILDSIKHQTDQVFTQSQIHYDATNAQYYLQFPSVDQQMRAMDIINSQPSSVFTASPNLKSNTPRWMSSLGIQPMKLGLDLRGGVHLTLNVDVNSSASAATEQSTHGLLRKIQSFDLDYDHAEHKDYALQLRFATSQLAQESLEILQKASQINVQRNKNTLVVSQSQSSQNDRSEYIMQRTVESIHRRVNELGLSEAIIQRQGKQHINIDLPGIQDIQKAKEIIGNTATLSFHIVKSFDAGQLGSPTDLLVPMQNQLGDVWIDAQSMLAGDEITYAISSHEQGKPIIQIQLNGGAAEESFYKATSQHKGDHLAIVYQETIIDPVTQERTAKKTVLSAPRINQGLRGQFVIEGMRSKSEADTLALLLRSGSLAAPIDIVHETTVGPSLGEDNIHKGLISIALGLSIVIVFMSVYYRWFGLIANIGLVYNLVLIVMCLSFLDATISLPSMAAIVLTVGMAVDANVLINERIREEIRSGTSEKMAIAHGYDKAFATILDANITTFIVSIVLYGLGSGMIKGFAITLIIGLFCSMLSAVYATKVITSSIQHRLTNLSRAIGI